jgi:hypothetical protein
MGRRKWKKEVEGGVERRGEEDKGRGRYRGEERIMELEGVEEKR